MNIQAVNSNQTNYTPQFTGRTVLLRSFCDGKSTYNLRALKKIPKNLNTTEVKYDKMLYLTKERKFFGIIPLPETILKSKIYNMTRKWLRTEVRSVKVTEDMGFCDVKGIYSEPKRNIIKNSYPSGKYFLSDILKNGQIKQK